MAGETLVTTPAQTIGESLSAEGSGVRDHTTWEEKRFATLDAMSIAIGQVGMMTGPSTVFAGTVMGLKGDFDERKLVPLTQEDIPAEGEVFDPEKKEEPYVIGGLPDLAISKQLENHILHLR